MPLAIIPLLVVGDPRGRLRRVEDDRDLRLNVDGAFERLQASDAEVVQEPTDQP